MTGKTTRRRYLAGLGAAVVASSAGCTGSGSSGPNLDEQLSKVEEATKEFQDPKAALQAGFKLGGPYVPGMGWHFSHPGRLETAAKEGLKLEKPPMLTYLDNDHTDGLQLAAVEYGVPAQKETPDLFADESAEATEKWHEHKAASHVFANGNGKQDSPKNISFADLTGKDNWAEFRPVDSDLKAGDTVSLDWGSTSAKEGENKEERVVDIVANHPTLKTLHAWVHVENPAGVFKPVNEKYADGHH